MLWVIPDRCTVAVVYSKSVRCIADATPIHEYNHVAAEIWIWVVLYYFACTWSI